MVICARFQVGRDNGELLENHRMWGGLASVRDVGVDCTCTGGGMRLVSDIGDLELGVRLRALRLSASMA